MNEHLFTSESAVDGYDPVLSATILTHDAIDKAHMSVALWVKDTVVCASSHSSEKLIKVVRHDFVVSLKHLFPLVLVLFYQFVLTLSILYE